jgi:hypothetical protein
MDKIVPALLVHLDAARDADVRLAFLALLETMLGTESVYKVSLLPVDVATTGLSSLISISFSYLFHKGLPAIQRPTSLERNHSEHCVARRSSRSDDQESGGGVCVHSPPPGSG